MIGNGVRKAIRRRREEPCEARSSEDGGTSGGILPVASPVHGPPTRARAGVVILYGCPPPRTAARPPPCRRATEALALMHEYTASESLRKHMLGRRGRHAGLRRALRRRSGAVGTGRADSRLRLRAISERLALADRRASVVRASGFCASAAGRRTFCRRFWDTRRTAACRARRGWRSTLFAVDELIGTDHRDGARQADRRACTTWTRSRC